MMRWYALDNENDHDDDDYHDNDDHDDDNVDDDDCDDCDDDNDDQSKTLVRWYAFRSHIFFVYCSNLIFWIE